MKETIQRGHAPLQTRGDEILASANRKLPTGSRRTLTRRVLHHVALRTRRNSIREFWDWVRCSHVELPQAKELATSLEIFGEGNEETELDDESPIFLLSTGWRSGSTLLQRIIVTDPTVLLWGEPLGEAAIFSQICKMVCDIARSPDSALLHDGDEAKFAALSTSWIATLYPPGCDFRRGLQSFLFNWLGHSARNRGFERWGLKEVRLGATEATLLRWVFPKAKFVALSRNPFDCYRSLADSGWHHVYFRRPEVRVDSAAGIARHWNRIATSWSEVSPSFPVFHLRYEDLINRRVDFRELESWLGIKLTEDIALSSSVGSTARRETLSAVERFIIANEARHGIRTLGYSKAA